ncbi:hypothetical protein M514_04034 [Trichuris suis]|uniref:Uncharacterized protein n=1 Tax=Trichuris suis TaxID=68888 RepID=A0A085MD20_9BILA|nr:hypothetical protein M513_04034 [Trichuris suis]KFD72532.1 hypothetical protein M514_04034 [Trichuris suis]
MEALLRGSPVSPCADSRASLRLHDFGEITYGASPLKYYAGVTLTVGLFNGLSFKRMDFELFSEHCLQAHDLILTLSSHATQ